MTTREEFAEAARDCEMQAERCASDADNFWLAEASGSFAIAARVLRALAEGAQLYIAPPMTPAQIRAQERERCEKKCEELFDKDPWAGRGALLCAEAIREMGDE